MPQKKRLQIVWGIAVYEGERESEVAQTHMLELCAVGWQRCATPAAMLAIRQTPSHRVVELEIYEKCILTCLKIQMSEKMKDH